MPDLSNNLYASSSVMRVTGQYRSINNTNQAQLTQDYSSSIVGSNTTLDNNTTPNNGVAPNSSTQTNVSTQQSTSTQQANPSITKESLSEKIHQLRINVGTDKASSTDQSQHPSSTARCQQTQNQKPAVDIASTLQNAKDVKQQIMSNNLSLSDNQDLARSLKPVFEFLDSTITRNMTRTQTDLNNAIAERDRTNSNDRTAVNAKISSISQKLSLLQSQQQSTTQELSSLTNYLH